MPRSGDCPFDPPPGLWALQEQGPIARVRLWDGSTPLLFHLQLLGETVVR
jgi:hypothetical protein